MYWDVNVDAIRIGTENFFPDKKPAGWKFSRAVTGCMDTGTSLVLVPDYFYDLFMESLLRDVSYDYDEDNKQYLIPCSLSKY
jgi:hypothetical protein